jgi:hypothetical protein
MPLYCACPKPEPVFTISGMPLYCACPRQEPVFTISYVDIGKIVDHHLKQLVFHNTLNNVYIFTFFQPTDITDIK